MVVRSLPVRWPICSGESREFAAEPVEGVGGFDRVQVLALDVLDEGDFEQAVVGDFPDDHRDPVRRRRVWRRASGVRRRPVDSGRPARRTTSG